MSNVTNDTTKKNRREAVWEVCDQLSSQGVKPSLRNVKMHYPRGSDSDVQKDVNAWYEHVFAQHARRRVIPTLPDSVVQAMEAFWETASMEARAQFDGERESQTVHLAQVQEALEAAQRDLAQMNERKAQSERDIDELRLELSHAASLHGDARQQIDKLSLDLEEARRYARKREEDLLSELAHIKASNELAVKAQREDFEVQVRIVREAAAQQSAEHQRAMERAEEHYRDLERRSLLEVDASRTKLKNADDAIDRFRNLAHERDIEVAHLRTELRLMREMTGAQMDDLINKNTALTSEIDALRRGIASEQ